MTDLGGEAALLAREPVRIAYAADSTLGSLRVVG